MNNPRTFFISLMIGIFGGILLTIILYPIWNSFFPSPSQDPFGPTILTVFVALPLGFLSGATSYFYLTRNSKK